MTAYRMEKDSLGEVKVNADNLWGAQTERSLKHFAIGSEKMPLEVIHAYGLIKKAAAYVNAELGVLPKKKAQLIVKAADKIIAGKLDAHFPLRVWQTGSGTQTNMNVNEVIANLTHKAVHPNDDVNKGQSSNDTFPAAMHIAAASAIHEILMPALKTMRDELYKKQKTFRQVTKIGRTHLQDAVPMTMGQEFSGYVAQIDADIKRIFSAANELFALPLGGTAIGTGLNAHPQFGERVCKTLSDLTNLPFKCAKNKFATIAAHDEIVFVSSALKTLCASLMKIANDIRFLASGPRCGLGELVLPVNEPGSSIMPGKVNPTQCEALTMICVQVFGCDAAISFAGSQGHFELNTFKPVMIYNLLQAIHLIADGCTSFTNHLLKGLFVNQKRIQAYLENSLMQVTALTPHIGYDKAAQIAKYAYEHDLTLMKACENLDILDQKTCEKLIKASF